MWISNKQFSSDMLALFMAYIYILHGASDFLYL